MIYQLVETCWSRPNRGHYRARYVSTPLCSSLFTCVIATILLQVLPRKTLFDGVNIAERADLLSSFPQQQQQLRRQNTSQHDRRQQERQQRQVGHSGEWRRSTVVSSWSEEQQDERVSVYKSNCTYIHFVSLTECAGS